ncbi:MAG: ferritin-like domain-containing protein [Chloroflexaceae bacterium]|nr:ferritin-like domain-containing protein [Chloroflexaceae bacterium]NJO04664.1 ferritin-like domain-containing protein [Chloroflexaceae bacterium]
MAMTSLQDLYVEQLQDLYSAERQITEALPKMARAAKTDTLRMSFEGHLDQTRQQIDRLERIFKNMRLDPGTEHCEAMEGIIKEGEELMSKDADQDVLEAGLIASAQRVEHYEIAGYGTVCTWAKMLGRQDDLSLLQQTLTEEKETDMKLTNLAERSINPKAM